MELTDFPPLNALYVGDLSKDVTESMLFNKFAAVGPVKSVRICKDSITKNSLGYAYVNFESGSDAERALETLNWEILNGKPMRIMWSQRDPHKRKSGAGNIFIKNLDKSIDSKTLCDTFSAFGNILSCKIASDEEGKSKGYGFIQFETEKDAETAIGKVNGMLICEKKVYVGKFKSKKERETEVGVKTDDFTNVFVKNFGDSLDEAKLYELFSKFGNIKSHVIMKREDGKSKGFGFVDFEDTFAAKASILELNNIEIDGKPLFVGRALTKGERKTVPSENKTCVQGVNLYIKHLDDSIDDDFLRLLFSPFGTITSAKVMTYENNRSKGFGFVCFSSQEEATHAIIKMNKRFVVSKPLYVGLAQSKEDRKIQVTTKLVKFMNSFNQMFQLNEPYNMSNVAHPQRDLQSQYVAIPARWPNPLFQDHNVTQTVEVAHAPPPMYPGARHNRSQIAGPNSLLVRPFDARNFNSTSMIRSRPLLQGNQTRRSNIVRASNSRPLHSSWLPQNLSSSLASSGINALSNQPSYIPKPVENQYLHEQQESMSLTSFTGQDIRPQTATNQDIHEPLAAEQTITSRHSANQVLTSRTSSTQQVTAFPNSATRAISPHSANQIIAPRSSTMQQTIAFPHSETLQATASPNSTHNAFSHSVTQQATTSYPLDAIARMQEPLTTSILANLTPQERKLMLGERLYPHVKKLYPELSSKITGMLLEIDDKDLFHLLENPILIKEKADDAFSVLEAFRLSA